MGKKKKKKRKTYVDPFLLMVIVLFDLVFGGLICYFAINMESIFVFGLFFGVIILSGIMLYKESEKKCYIENIHAFRNEYEEYAKKQGMTEADIQATLINVDEHGCGKHIPQYLWICNNSLMLFPRSTYYEQRVTVDFRPKISNLVLKLKSIPIDSILYFEEIGELRKYTTVSGGGSSLKGALLGYAIADDVGAIIGSREPITTNVVSEDDRRIELIYKNQDGQIENLEFMHDAYDVFKKLIPLKELKKINSLNNVQGIKEETDIGIQEHKSVKDKLKQLKDLQDEGLITEEEFTEQKKKILEAI